MKLFDRKQLWARLQGTILVDNFPLVVEEIDRAVRKARSEERAKARILEKARALAVEHLAARGPIRASLLR
jgi:hypothetical protein